MQIVLIFAVFFVCRVVQFTFLKKTSVRIQGRTQLLIYTAYQYLISTVLSVFLLTDIRSVFSVSPSGLVIGVLGGIAMFSSSLCSMSALNRGVQMILTSLFSSISIIIPTVASTFLFGEDMSIWQIIGVAALLYAAGLLLGISKESYRDFSAKGFLLLLGLFAADGMTMLAQKCYPYWEPEGDVAVYTFLAFGTAFVLTGIMGTVDMGKAHTNITKVMNKDLAVGGAVLAAVLFLVMYLGIVAVPLIPAVILYSLVAGGTLLVAFGVATVIFKEPVTKKNIIGVLISILALIIINAL